MKKYLLLFFMLISFSIIAQDNQQSWNGTASYYHSKFNGRKTSSGDIFNNGKLSAACNKLPLGTKVRVINLSNNNSVIVTINDRMHPRNKRLIDLSAAAAKQLGFFGNGLCKVRVELISISDSEQDNQDSLSKHPVHKKRHLKKKSH